MSADTTDYDAMERQLRAASGFEAPKVAARNDQSSTRAAAVIREPVPLNERPSPDSVTITSPLADEPLQLGAVICGPVTTCSQAADVLEDDAGWLVQNSTQGSEPVPAVGGRYYGGHPKLAIIAEMTMLPEAGSEGSGSGR